MQLHLNTSKQLHLMGVNADVGSLLSLFFLAFDAADVGSFFLAFDAADVGSFLSLFFWLLTPLTLAVFCHFFSGF